MNRKEKYIELLKNDRWIDKRNHIYIRDNYRCAKCGIGNKTLQVHHKVYVSKSNPWEIDDRHLITVCVDCHNAIHKSKKIKTIPINKKINKEKKLIKYKKEVEKWRKIYPI